MPLSVIIKANIKNISKYADFMRDQVHELLTNYGPIGLLWFDGGGAFRTNRVEALEGATMAKLIHETQP